MNLIFNRLTFVLLLLTMNFVTGAQVVFSEWLVSMGDKGWDIVNGMTSDSIGNIYITGSIADTNIKAYSNRIETSANFNSFLIKYDVNGTVLWKKNLGASPSGYGNLITMTPTNLIITAGSTLTFRKLKETELSVLQFSLSCRDLDGKIKWTTTMTGSSIDFLSSLVTDKLTGDLILTGYFNDTLEIQNNKVKSAGKSDGVVLRFDPTGKFKSMLTLTGKGEDHINSVTTDPLGNSILTGTYQRKSRFGQKKMTELKSPDENGAFIAQINPSGECLNATTICTGKNIQVSSIARNDHHIFITGYFNDNIILGSRIYSSQGSDDVFLISLSNTFNIEWIKTFGGDRKDRSTNLVCVKNELIMTGSFCTTFSVDHVSVTSRNESNDVLVLSLDTAGKVNWMRHLGSNSDDYSKCLTIDKNNHIFISGSYRDSLDINRMEVISKGAEDVFVARLENCNTISPKFPNPEYLCHGTFLTMDAGDGFSKYNWNNGGSYQRTFKINREGHYPLELIATNGCILEDTIHVAEVQNPEVFIGNDTTIYISSNLKLSPGQGYSSYLWNNGNKDSVIFFNGFNCPEGQNLVWVQVTDTNKCSGYDEMVITVDKTNNNQNSNALASICQVFPNPTDGNISVTFSANLNNIDLRIFDLFGQGIVSKHIDQYHKETPIVFNLTAQATGLYTLTVETDDSFITKKIVLQ